MRIRKITEGEMGSQHMTIWLCRYRDGRLCIEKTIITDGYAEQEIEMLTRVQDHPHINQVFQYEEDIQQSRNNRFGVVKVYLEYCEFGAMDGLRKK